MPAFGKRMSEATGDAHAYSQRSFIRWVQLDIAFERRQRFLPASFTQQRCRLPAQNSRKAALFAREGKTQKRKIIAESAERFEAFDQSRKLTLAVFVFGNDLKKTTAIRFYTTVYRKIVSSIRTCIQDVARPKRTHVHAQLLFGQRGAKTIEHP